MSRRGVEVVSRKGDEGARMGAYQLTLFDEALTFVPRFPIGRAIRVIHADSKGL